VLGYGTVGTRVSHGQHCRVKMVVQLQMMQALDRIIGGYLRVMMEMGSLAAELGREVCVDRVF